MFSTLCCSFGARIVQKSAIPSVHLNALFRCSSKCSATLRMLRCRTFLAVLLVLGHGHSPVGGPSEPWLTAYGTQIQLLIGCAVWRSANRLPRTKCRTARLTFWHACENLYIDAWKVEVVCVDIRSIRNCTEARSDFERAIMATRQIDEKCDSNATGKQYQQTIWHVTNN